ncbi:Cytochrome c oxidase subunit 5A, mitochondrial [Anabarilius grahami]|uniref:Cytochrome c oxidase subunit 5A, mitochondrial n=1 Tax=Anabarilius grahami TaxID=495550 RepID=A0A3N0YCD3_ANAGA|nr:Cytochrome c oxidase subunit 5A, mitochondrial [Anabarilius grahami]
MACALLTSFFILISAHLVESSGVFELKVHSFTSTNSVCKQSSDCQIFFRVCLKHSQDIILPETPCTYGAGMTDILSVDSISSRAHIRVPFFVKWPGIVSLIIEAWNAESSDQSTTFLIVSCVMNSTTAKNARISAAHGMMRLATSSVTPLETEFACLDGKANIAQNPSARQAVARSTVIVRPPVSASAALGGMAPFVTSAGDTRGQTSSLYIDSHEQELYCQTSAHAQSRDSRVLAGRLSELASSAARARVVLQVQAALESASVAARSYSHGKQETDEEFDARWITYFNKPDIDAWELRKGMNTLIGYDLVPEPKILEAALRACRRLDDLASAIRILEAVKDKAGPHKEIYPYVIQELQPTLGELGIPTPEELGIDKA